MTIQHLYPTTRPSLDLNFARQKRLDPRVTFTRGSTATYVDSDGLIKTAASGEARFDHDPETGESLGLLVEEARTNSITNSADFSSWTQSALTLSANVLTAPDGTLTASKITETGASTSKIIYKAFSSTLTVGVSATLSLFVKAGERFRVIVSDAQNSQGGYFNLNTLETSIFQGSPTLAISDAGNGWKRCSVTFSPTSTTAQPRFYIVNDSGAVNYTGDGTSGLYIWGAQLETGSFPTSYIPTDATPGGITRSADVASMTGTNFSSWYNQSEGTVFLKSTAIKRPSGNSFFFGISDGTINNRLGIYGPSPNAARGIVVSSGTSISLLTFDPTGPIVNSAIAVKAGDYGFLHDGMPSPATSASTQVPPVVTTLAFGVPYGTGAPDHAFTVARLAYYPTRLTDTQLQALTL